jgi:hypothetical protein
MRQQALGARSVLIVLLLPSRPGMEELQKPLLVLGGVSLRLLFYRSLVELLMIECVGWSTTGQLCNHHKIRKVGEITHDINISSWITFWVNQGGV